MADPAAVEREILALVAVSDAWLPANAIQTRLNLTYSDLAAALRDLVQAGDLDWNGVVPGEVAFSHDSSCVAYHLPFREMALRRRIWVAS